MPPAISRRLLVLQHGSHGHARDFDALRRAIDAVVVRHGVAGDVRVVAPDVVEGRGTDKGLQHCVSTLTPPIAEEVGRFQAEAQRAGEVGAVSFLGHSFGGLMLRGVAGQLADLDYIVPHTRRRDATAPLQWGTFVTVASPHLGVGHTSLTLRTLARAASRAIDSQAYRDLLLESQALPSLVASRSVGMGLEAFDRRIAIAAAGDHLVSPASALVAAASKGDVRAHSRIRRMPRTASEAFVRIDVSAMVPQRRAAANDLYSDFTDLGPWRRSSPRLSPEHAAQVAFMAHELRRCGTWDTWVARFPLWAAPAAHRAIIGKAPYHAEPRFSAAHVDGIAELLLGLDPTAS